MPEGAVYVGRPTKWGNSAKAGDCGDCRWGQHDGEHRPMSAADAVEDYRIGWEALAAAEASIGEMTAEEHRMTGVSGIQVDLFADLRGRDLACWCPTHSDGCAGNCGTAFDNPPCPAADGLCHADVLLELANS